MKLHKSLLAVVAGLSLAAAAAPAATTAFDPPPLGIPAGTYNWYEDPLHQTLVGYKIVECDGTVHGPYPGPGRPWAEITIYEEYIPQPC